MENSSQLPEEMIQHIQSFLSGKEAVKTTILSKSWYTAWLTRPNLDLEEKDIPTLTAFVEFVNKTLQRYDKLNRKIQRFKLSGNCTWDWDRVSGAIEWTKKAMKLGATDLDIETSSKFVLPREVLESESLVRLSMHYGRIDLHKASCSKLKSLNLCQVLIEDDNYNIWDIIWTCPLIEELVLSLLRTSSYNNLVLKPGLNANNFHKLKVFSLKFAKMGEWLFRDLSSKFPCLKEFTLYGCTGYEEIQICSDSLERVVLCEGKDSRMSSVEFDVPRIRRFDFTSFFVPSLSFKTTSMEWESHIFLISIVVVDSSWFVEYRNFLQELSSSEIYLYPNISPQNAYKYASHMIGLPKAPIVERLELCFDAPSSVESALLEELFWSCRPNFIMLSYVKKYDIVKLICKTLIKEEYGIHDLEEVNVEISGHIAWAWSRNLPTKTPRASKFAYPGWIGSDIPMFASN